MNIAFRVDSSLEIGTGHVMRCLTLADELKRLGNACRFVCREHPRHLGDLIAKGGHGLTFLPAPSDSQRPPSINEPDNYELWLGVPWQQDAKQTLDAIGPLKPDWLVVDHYSLDAAWERMLAKAVGRVMVLDDLANRFHECAL